MKKKILFLLPSLAGGGAERTLINLLGKINYSNFEVDLVVVLKDGVYLNSIPIEVNVVYLFNRKLLVRVLAWLQKKLGFTFLLRNRTEKKVIKNYDLGISFLDGNFTDLLFFIKNLNKRYTWVHGSYLSNDNFARFYKNKYYLEKLKKQRYGRLDGIYFVSNDAKEEFIQVFGVYPRMDVLYNFMDSEAVISKAVLTSYLKSDSFHFVALGSLFPVKGFDRLIRASQIVRNAGYDFKLSILGSGPEKNNLEELVNKCNLNEVVDFLGFVNNPYPILKSANVFIMSSVSEALPTVLCEAMILGKATLVTKCSGCNEIVANGEFGLLSEQDDNNLAENMIKYIVNPELVNYYGNQSLNRAKIFDDGLVLESYYKILSS